MKRYKRGFLHTCITCSVCSIVQFSLSTNTVLIRRPHNTVHLRHRYALLKTYLLRLGNDSPPLPTNRYSCAPLGWFNSDNLFNGWLVKRGKRDNLLNCFIFIVHKNMILISRPHGTAHLRWQISTLKDVFATTQQWFTTATEHVQMRALLCVGSGKRPWWIAWNSTKTSWWRFWFPRTKLCWLPLTENCD